MGDQDAVFTFKKVLLHSPIHFENEAISVGLHPTSVTVNGSHIANQPVNQCGMGKLD